MKKGSIAIIALVLAAIIGAVILYSGTSSSVSATGGASANAAPPQQDPCVKCKNTDSNADSTGLLTPKGVKACCSSKGNKPGACANSNIICLTGLSSPCSPTGTSNCANPLTCVPDVGPQLETCDGTDEDCDGAADDGNPGGGGPCQTGQLGECAAGTTNCISPNLVCNANNAPVAEICDGKDQDCDGANDNGIPPVACMTIDGCAGTISCVGGAASPCIKTDPSCPATSTPTATPAVTQTPTSCTIVCGPAGSIGPGNGCSTNEVCSPDQCACTPGATPSPTISATETPSMTGTPTDCVGATGVCPGPAGQSCCEGLTCFAGQCGAP